MTATIVNPQYDRGVAALVTPPPYGYLLLAATVAPPKGPPIVRRSAARRSAVATFLDRCRDLRFWQRSADAATRPLATIEH